MYLILAYLKFLWSATNQHGVHSPFVFNLVTKCLYDNTKYSAYKDIIAYRNRLLQDHTTLEIKDYGAGSRRFNSNKRKVSAIAKYAGSSLHKAKLLFRIVKYLQPQHCLELGTSLGIATYALSKGNPNTTVISIEGCPNSFAYTQNALKEQQAKNIVLKLGTFKEVIPKMEQKPLDLVFIDGHHSKSATLELFEALLPLVHNDTLFIIDDIYWSKEMTEAWHAIKAHNSVTVTVDCFFIGLVFFRTEQAKEHFKIRL
jgi:predicted O-methyltransferase YrrM